ncbi:MAG: HU family DNA-binding protein [bacterium]|nr:HU family DNA-binding protein [bacterium]
MAKLKKGELIDMLATKTEMSKKESEDMIEALLDIITTSLQKGDEITFTGFGSFVAKMRKGRIGINPKNPTQKINIPASIVPRFKAGKGLKDALQKK